jgi:hypothetical protein
MPIRIPPLTIPRPSPRTLVDALVATTKGLSFDHFVTLTVKGNRSPIALARVFTDVFIRALERPHLAGRRIDYIGACETSLDGQVHIHCVLHGTSALSCSRIAHAWPAGIATVERFNPQLDGVAYALADVFDPDDDRIQLLLRDLRRQAHPRRRGRRKRTELR